MIRVFDEARCGGASETKVGPAAAIPPLPMVSVAPGLGLTAITPVAGLGGGLRAAVLLFGVEQPSFHPAGDGHDLAGDVAGEHG